MERSGWIDRKFIKTGDDSSKCGPKWTSGRRKQGGKEIMGRFGAGTRNKEGLMAVDFVKKTDLAIVNIYFKKKHNHRVTIKMEEKVPK